MIHIYESDNPSNGIQIPPLKKPNLPAVVVFYRSQLNADNKPNEKYGTKDTQYNGEFGFDRFDKKIIAEGLATEYEKLKGVEVKDPVAGNSHEYLCPYLSLYPPNVTGNLNNTKSNVTLYVKLEEDKEKGTDEPDFGAIHFQSSDPNSIAIAGTQANKVNGAQEQSKKIKLTIGDKAQPLSIECKQAFSTPIKVTAKTSKGTIIGQLIVVPNQDIYHLTVQPVYVTLGTTTDDKKTDAPIASIAAIKAKALTECLNNKSLNQALIHCELSPVAHTFTYDKALVREYIHTQNSKGYLYKDDAKRKAFNSAIEKQYGLILNNSGNSNASDETLKNEIYFRSGTYRAVQNFLAALDKRFKYNVNASNPFKEAQKTHENKELTNAYNHKKVQEALADFRVAEQKMNAELQKKGISTNTQTFVSTGIPKQGTVYVFYYPDIEAAYENTANDLSQGSVPGYTLRSNGVSHIFNTGFDKADAIVHEICHGLGLPHTFEEELGKAKDSTIKTKEDYEQEIEIAEKELEELEDDEKEYYRGIEAMKKDGYNDLELFSKYKELNKKYTAIKNTINIEKPNLYLKNKAYNAYLIFTQIITKTEELKIIEKDFNKIIFDWEASTDITQIKTSIISKKTKIKSLEQLKDTSPKENSIEGESNYNSQSATLENYMDYDFNSSGSNKFFKRKTLTQNQWNTIREIGIQNGYFNK